jgi:hypothetical protein
MGKYTLVVTLIILPFFITSCSFRNTWLGIYYPLNDDDIYSPIFQTKEECIDWALSMEARYPPYLSNDVGWRWECSSNCKVSDSYQYLQKYAPDKATALGGPTYVCDEGFDDGDYKRGDY